MMLPAITAARNRSMRRPADAKASAWRVRKGRCCANVSNDEAAQSGTVWILQMHNHGTYVNPGR